MIVWLFVTIAALTVSVTPPSVAALPSAPGHQAPAAVRLPRIAIAQPHLSAHQLYSFRARRRFSAYLRMRLLELREAGLGRAADVVQRHLSVDSLVPRP